MRPPGAHGGGRARARFLPLALGCAAALALGAVTGAGAKPRKPYRNPTVGRDLAYQIRGMHRAKKIRGLIYRSVDGQTLRMDVYHPQIWSGWALPVVVIGGPPAYRAGKDSGQKVGWSQLVAASGLAAATFDIRPDDFLSTPRNPSEDVAAAIAYLRTNASRLGIDPNRMCTLGFSYGTAPWHLWAAMKERPPWIRCNAAYYGPLEFHPGDFEIDPAVVGEYSALTYLERDGARISPMLIAKAGRDDVRIRASIDHFVAEARRLDAPVQLLVHPTGPHGFDVTAPGARTRLIISRTLAFFRAHLL